MLAGTLGWPADEGFEKFAFNYEDCSRELDDFRELLGASVSLRERDQILPFFRSRRHLSAFLGTFNPKMISYDRLAFEFDLFGDFTCDLAVGDRLNRAYCFVEFEDASPDGIFVKKRGKNTPEWSPRFDHGASQIVDWLWKLDDMGPTVEFRDRFEGDSISFIALLVVGRGRDFGKREDERLRWRREHLVVHSKQINCMTFDQLYRNLKTRMERFASAAKDTAEQGPA